MKKEKIQNSIGAIVVPAVPHSLLREVEAKVSKETKYQKKQISKRNKVAKEIEIKNSKFNWGYCPAHPAVHHSVREVEANREFFKSTNTKNTSQIHNRRNRNKESKTTN